MSAFLVSDLHTVTVARFAVSVGLHTDAAQCAITLRAANNAAMRARYGDAPTPLDAIGRLLALPMPHRPWSWFAALAACLEYQCAEGDVLERAETGGHLVRAIRARALALSGGAQDDGVWELRAEQDLEPPVPAPVAPAMTADDLHARHPGMVDARTCKGGALVAAAKNLRIELKRAFPSVRFGVRTDRFSGGDSIDISWTDGPTSGQVEMIANRYEAGSFDGMTDSYTYSLSAFNAAFGDAKYVHTRREHSDNAVAACTRTVFCRYPDNLEGIAPPSVEDFRNGRLWAVRVPGLDRDLQSLIHGEMSRRTWALSATVGATV